LYGDFSNFVIVDRWPSSLEIIPHLFGANRRPTGQRGAFLYARTGSDSANDNAFRMLVA
jgi:predicted phage gp36 major capsid-like protein